MRSNLQIKFAINFTIQTLVPEVAQFKFDINVNSLKGMMEINLDSTKSFSADIDFALGNYKPKILDNIFKIRDFKKRPDLDSIFHDISRNEASNIDKDTGEILISKLIDSNVITVKKTKQGQKSLFLTKDATAIPTEDNAVFFS